MSRESQRVLAQAEVCCGEELESKRTIQLQWAGRVFYIGRLPGRRRHRDEPNPKRDHDARADQPATTGICGENTTDRCRQVQCAGQQGSALVGGEAGRRAHPAPIGPSLPSFDSLPSAHQRPRLATCSSGTSQCPLPPTHANPNNHSTPLNHLLRPPHPLSPGAGGLQPSRCPSIYPLSA